MNLVVSSPKNGMNLTIIDAYGNLATNNIILGSYNNNTYIAGFLGKINVSTATLNSNSNKFYSYHFTYAGSGSYGTFFSTDNNFN